MGEAADHREDPGVRIVTHEVRLELLLGRAVLDRDGRSIGHLQEVRAESRDGRMVVTSYLIGTRALLERLSVEVWRAHAGGVSSGYAARWDQLDLSDPRTPRLTCDVADLARWPGSR